MSRKPFLALLHLLTSFGSARLNMTAEFVHNLSIVARQLGRSEEIPKYVIRDLTDILLRTTGNSLDNNSEANRLVKKSRRMLAKNTARLIFSTTQDTSTQAYGTSTTIQDSSASAQHLLVWKIRAILVEMILSQQIKSPDKLYPHVKKAVQALQFVLSGSRCVIGGDPMNVEGAKDEFWLTQCCVGPGNGEEYGSASACLYSLGGTTSYMNATIQCLHRVPELKSALIEWHPLFEKSSDHLLTAATRDLFKQLDKSDEPVAPRVFFQLFEETYPTPGQMDNHNPMDAEACWMGLLDTLSWSLKSPGFSSENLDIVDNLFNIKLVSRAHCCESGETPKVEKSVRMLKWIISPATNHLHDSLQFCLERGLDKHSSFCIGGLPRYLTIRCIRIKHKANFKIDLMEVDVYDLCSDELRANLEVARKGSSNGSGESSKATGKEGQEARLTGVYDMVAILAYHKQPCHYNIKSLGHYTALIKPEKNVGGRLWFHYKDESVLIRNQEYVDEMMRGGTFGPYMCLYKARVV